MPAKNLFSCQQRLMATMLSCCRLATTKLSSSLPIRRAPLVHKECRWITLTATGACSTLTRHLSTSSPSPSSEKVATASSDDNKNNNHAATAEEDEATDSVIWYKRKENRTFWLGFGFRAASVQTLYWLWYNGDFIPAVNEVLSFNSMPVDPMTGVVGLGFSLIVNTVTTIFAMKMVSKLEYRPTTHDIAVYTHTLFPLVNPSKKPSKVFPVGQILFDPNSKETKDIIQDPFGAKGFVVLLKDGKWSSNPPYVMNIYDGEVKEHLCLDMVQALVAPEHFLMQQNKTQTQYSIGDDQKEKANAERRRRAGGVKLKPRRQR